MKKIVVFIIVFCISLMDVPSYAGEKRTYKQLTNGKTLEYSLNMVGESPEYTMLNITFPEILYEYQNDKKTGATLKWSMSKKESVLHGVRQGNTIELKEEVNGKVYTNRIKIDDALWIQPVEYGLQWLARDQDNSALRFWVISPYDGKISKLVAKKKGVEMIKLGDQEYDAVRVKLTATGWKSLFWSANYWFRESDGIFLKFRGAFGAPGTSETLTELINE